MYRAVFVDRDGTINRDVPYCGCPENFELLPTVAQGMRLLNKRGLKVVVVTNQSGIARGYFTEETLARIHQKMRDDLAKEGAFVHGIYYCPHHPEAGCRCRKPKNGLFYQAAAELQIDLAGSYLIGDKLLDMAAAKELNCRAVLVPSSEPEISLAQEKGGQIGADFISADFYTAATWIVTQLGALVE